jgi:hypothetical protein
VSYWQLAIRYVNDGPSNFTPKTSHENSFRSEKAFDSVNFDKLFQTLTENERQPLTVHQLLDVPLIKYLCHNSAGYKKH